MDLHTWLLYTLAAAGLSLSPGPNSLLALTHGALHGARKTLFTVLGGSVGFTVIIALSMFGIGALLKASLIWLTVLKVVGGLYLVWLGIQVWRSPPIQVNPEVSGAGGGSADRLVMFRQGALSAMTNPKGILFFAAFLPQFIDPAHSLALQFTIMTATFVVIEFVFELAIVSVAQRVSSWLARVGKAFNRVCGGAFMAIGAAMSLRN